MENNIAISKDSYLLVSDSNEGGNQFDTKKVSWGELVELAQDSIVQKHLDIMDSYLTRNQIEIQKNTLEWKLQAHRNMFDQIKDENGSKRKLKVADGQIILLDSDRVDMIGVSPIEYLYRFWDISQNFNVSQIHDCMLRGVTDMDSDNPNAIKRPDNVKVGLTNETMPPHMHHSGITDGAKVSCLKDSDSPDDRLSVEYGNVECDMFYNDSFSTGLQRNEVDGVYDRFTVQPTGDNVSSDPNHPKMMCNNMPVYRKYYAFLIRRNSV